MEERSTACQRCWGVTCSWIERHESEELITGSKLLCQTRRSGSCCFFCHEDHLFRIFPQGVLNFIKSSSSKPGESLQAGMLNSAIASNQQKMEAHYFDIRKQVLKYDNIANDQRLAIYQQRNDLLDLESIHDDLIFMTISAIRSLLKKSLPENDNNPAKHILEVLKQKFRHPIDENLVQDISADNIKTILDDESENSPVEGLEYASKLTKKQQSLCQLSREITSKKRCCYKSSTTVGRNIFSPSKI